MASGLATRKTGWLTGVFVMLVLGLTFAGVHLAQTQTTTAVAVRNFEVIAVDGNRLVLRDQRGTNEYTVPSDFVFAVDGKKMTVSDLKKGMKGTATVTTTTTIKPVVVTEVRSGVVLNVWAGSVTVLEQHGWRAKEVHTGPVERPGSPDFQGRPRDHRLPIEQGR